MKSPPTVPLLALVAVVLAAHLLLLRAAPGPVRLSARIGAQPFLTRSIAAPAPVAETGPSAQPVMTPVARKLEPRRARTARIVDVDVDLVAASTSATGPQADMPPPLTSATGPQPGPATAPQPAHAPELAAPPAVFTIPGSMRLHYKVTAQVRSLTWFGDGELAWHHDGDSYEAKLEISAPLLPTRTQRSTGRITAGGLAPLRFSDKVRTEEAAHFERDKGKVSFSSNRPDAPLQPGAQDRLSVMLQLGAMIAGQPHKFRPAAHVVIQTAGTRDAEPWVFTVEREEELQLPGGTLATVKLTRNPRREFDQKVELWLAPAMDYAPVRLRLTQPNGDSVDQQWSFTDRG